MLNPEKQTQALATMRAEAVRALRAGLSLAAVRQRVYNLRDRESLDIPGVLVEELLLLAYEETIA